MADVFGFLQSVAPDYGATLVATASGGEAEITIVRPGGSRHAFHLDVAIVGNHATVRELPGQNELPLFCPDRHINLGGTFCLGWGEENPNTITNIEAARRWWSVVNQFLARQVNASRRGVFPGGEHGRAHGDAARHQSNAEEAAIRLGRAFAHKALSGKFSIRRDNRPGKRRLELWDGTKRIARVSIKSQSIVGGHTLCPCGITPPRKISECGEHGKDLATFILENYKCTEEDRAFLDELASHGCVCCETLNACGLRQAIKRRQTTAKETEPPHARRSKYWQPPGKSKRPR